MSLQDRYIEQCTAEEVLSACMDASYGLPGMQAVRAVRDDIGVGKMKLAAAITAQGVPTESDAALATMATNVAAIVAHYFNTNDESLQLGYSGDVPTTTIQFLLTLSSIVYICKKQSSNSGSIGLLSSYSSVKKIVWEKDTEISQNYWNTRIKDYLEEAEMWVATSTTTNRNIMFYDFKYLRRLYMPKMQTFHNENIYGCVRLIDLTVGESFSAGSTIQWLNLWNPTEALLTNSTSLVEDGETFGSNREKLLYNIREHFAALLPTVTTTSKIQLNSTLKAAIDADNATASAFSNKGWTLYS